MIKIRGISNLVRKDIKGYHSITASFPCKVFPNEFTQCWLSLWPLGKSLCILQYTGVFKSGVCGDISTLTGSGVFYINQQRLVFKNWRGGAGKVRGSPKSEGLDNFIAICPIAVHMFQSGLKRWTKRSALYSGPESSTHCNLREHM